MAPVWEHSLAHPVRVIGRLRRGLAIAEPNLELDQAVHPLKLSSGAGRGDFVCGAERVRCARTFSSQRGSPLEEGLMDAEVDALCKAEYGRYADTHESSDPSSHMPCLLTAPNQCQTVEQEMIGRQILTRRDGPPVHRNRPCLQELLGFPTTRGQIRLDEQIR